MENFVQVKNIKIGEGIPKICIPLVAKTKEEFIEMAKDLISLKFDLVELRIDHFQKVENIDAIKEVIKEVMIYGTIIPYIITFVFGRIIIIFSYVDIILVKNAQNLKGV